MNASGEFVVAWTAYDGPAGYPDYVTFGVGARKYDASGVPQFEVDFSAGDIQLSPSVAMEQTGKFIVVWEQGDHFIRQVIRRLVRWNRAERRVLRNRALLVTCTPAERGHQSRG